MSFDALLIHTVEIYRRDGQLDRFNQPVEPETGGYSSAVSVGRLDEPSGGERFGERSRDVVKYTHRLFLPLGVELFEADRVTVRDSAGNVLAKSAEVVSITWPEDFLGPHHIEAKIDNSKSGEPYASDR